MFKCEICGRECKNLIGLASHITKNHKLKIKDYYLKYINPEKGICKTCGKDTKFHNLRHGYNKFCGPKCSTIHPEINQKRINTCIIKFGCESSNQCEEVKNKKKETCLKKWNCENPSQNPEVKEKTKQTNIKNTGYGNPFQDPKTKEKSKQTNFEKTGYANPSQDPKIKEKKKETNLKNSGFEYPLQNPEVKKRSKQTNLENSGYESPMQNPVTREKSKQTYFRKTGYNHALQNPESKEKQQESILKNNNGIHPNKLTYKQVQERYPLLVEVEKLIEGPNGEIWGHCKNSNCKNSKENGGYFELTPYQINMRNKGINRHDTDYFYCCEECKNECPLYHRSATALHNLLNENKEILYAPIEYNTWKEEVLYRQCIENNTDTNFCEYCHATENLDVHHEVPQKLVPGYALDPDNGIIVCEDCHYEKGHKKGTECSTGNLANKICK